MITKSERAELRSLIRQRFKVLRADIDQRKAELVAELETHITDRFAQSDKEWADAMYLIEEAAREANRKANDVLQALNLHALDQNGRDYLLVTKSNINKPTW